MPTARLVSLVSTAIGLAASLGCSSGGSSSLAGPTPTVVAPLGAQLPVGNYQLTLTAGDTCTSQLAEAATLTLDVTLTSSGSGYVVKVPGHSLGGFGLSVAGQDVAVDFDFPVVGTTPRGLVSVTAFGQGSAGAATAPGISIPVTYAFELLGVMTCSGTDGRLTLTR